jgi:uncharacterized repeat protein (TIGR02543 family)
MDSYNSGCITAWNPDVHYDAVCGGPAGVSAIAVSRSRVYLGGYFQSVGPSGSETVRRNAAAVDDTTGAVDATWADPGVSDSYCAASVGTIAVAENPTSADLDRIYLGGYFGEAAGVTRSNAAAVNGRGELESWAPNPDDQVNVIEYDGVASLLGGAFRTLSGNVINYAGVLDSATGTLSQQWPALGSATMTVAKAGTGAGTVVSSPAGIDCGSTCTADFVDGTTITLTATPAAGSTFAGWSGDCAGSAATCTVVATYGRSITATFTSNALPVPPAPAAGGGTAAASAAGGGSAGLVLPVPPRLPVSPANGFTALEVPVTCRASSGAALARCTATITADPGDLQTPAGLAISPGGRVTSVVLGSATVVPTGGAKAIRLRVRLNAAGRKALRERLQVRTTVTVAATTTGGATGSRSTRSALRLPTHVVVPTDGIFATSQWTPDAQGDAFLTRLAQLLPARVKAVTCTGYTDDRGIPMDNVWLGRERARSVCAGLEAHGVHAARATIVTKGASDPRASNATAAGRALNRRVAVTLTY